MLNRRRFVATGFALPLLGYGRSALADDYPSRPITLIVPQAPGGGNDTIARIIAQKMTQSLGQQVIVDNRPGAGGTLGTRQLARSTADGYAIAMGSTGTLTMAPTAVENAGYDPRKDFAPVGMIAKSAIVLVVGPSVKAQSVQELVAQAKKDPQAFTYGSGGAGTPNHLTAVMFADRAGITLIHIPFKGAGPAINDMLGGHVSMIFSSLPPTIGNIKAGTLRALGTCALSRAPMLPEVPTMEEAGFKGFEAEQRYGLIAPAGTPDQVLRKLNQSLRAALDAEDVKERIAADGAVVNPSTPEEYATDIDREEAKWAKVVQLAKATK
ncbi:MAG TPA: tripartite tricarboxylate transporter substrate binding protein [Pseudolabrys sp.]|jgi:tripartite-type tricarboxylate transporter receptor subunit TctC|nr:tripartite tricarboxylate transporter substrate binding protein [Pseudolabrys sp.]